MSETAIGIDLGGTRIKAVSIDINGEVLQQYNHPTQDGDDKVWKNALASAVNHVQSNTGSYKTVVGISAPGLPNSNNSAIAYMPGRLKGLENFEWTDFLGIRSFVLNDAVSAMMAEVKFGVAKGLNNVVMLTLGTGVGGALLIDGKPYKGTFSKAGHFGHMVIDSNGHMDITGIPGSLENAIGNCSLERRTSGKFSSTKELLKAYKNGDYFSAEVWLTSVKKLAIGLASISNILAPELIILGGGITEAGKDLFEPLEEFMDVYEWRPGGLKTQILQAQYGDQSGAVGAACFAMEMNLTEKT